MVDVYSKLSTTVIEKTIGEVAKEKTYTTGDEANSPFKQMLDSIDTSQEMVDGLGMNNQQLGLPSSEVNAISANGIPIDVANMGVGAEQPDGMRRVISLLSEVNDGQMQMEGLVNQILYSNKRFSNQELLAIQAHVFHFAQVTELVVKAADQGVSSLKAILNTNIQ